MALLEVNNLQISFQLRKGEACVVDGVSFTLDEGKTLGLVGESGSGKSVLSMSILRLLEKNCKAEGEIRFQDEKQSLDLIQVPLSEMYRIRGNRISMIFQEPMTALNPVFSIEKQLSEPLYIHRGFTKKQGKEEARRLLEKVGITQADKVAKQYPHQLSGGMRQRVMIAMALACQPKLLIADEPTTALDVTIQAQVLKLMKKLQKENGAAILFITHDLGVIQEIADDVAVMYCGQIVEKASVDKIFTQERYSHPYTEGLLLSLPDFTKSKLEPIPGNVPSPLEIPKGCRFSPRCKYCTEKCQKEEPSLMEVEEGHWARCFYADRAQRRSKEHEKFIIRRSSS